MWECIEGAWILLQDLCWPSFKQPFNSNLNVGNHTIFHNNIIIVHFEHKLPWRYFWFLSKSFNVFFSNKLPIIFLISLRGTLSEQPSTLRTLTKLFFFSDILSCFLFLKNKYILFVIDLNIERRFMRIGDTRVKEG